MQGVGRSKEEGGNYREGSRVGDETGLLYIGFGMEEKVILTPLFQKSGTKNIFKEYYRLGYFSNYLII